MTAAGPPALVSCPHCGSGALDVWGVRTSRAERGAYAGWTTTTGRFACTACGAVTSLSTRVPPSTGEPPPTPG